MKGEISMAEYKLLIDGELVGSSTGKTADDMNPATGEVIAQVPVSTLDDMNRAVAAAGAGPG
jgi:betaine-aldehyde dehydrogenase